MVPGRNEFQEPLARIVALSPQQWAINALAATKNEFFLPPSMCWMRSFLNSLIKRAHVRAGKRPHPAWAILSFPCYIGIRIVLLSVRSAVHPDCLWSCHWFPFIPLLHVIDCSSSLISIFNFNKTANVGWWCQKVSFQETRLKTPSWDISTIHHQLKETIVKQWTM